MSARSSESGRDDRLERRRGVDPRAHVAQRRRGVPVATSRGRRALARARARVAPWALRRAASRRPAAVVHAARGGDRDADANAGAARSLPEGYDSALARANLLTQLSDVDAASKKKKAKKAKKKDNGGDGRHRGCRG